MSSVEGNATAAAIMLTKRMRNFILTIAAAGSAEKNAIKSFFEIMVIYVSSQRSFTL